MNTVWTLPALGVLLVTAGCGSSAPNPSAATSSAATSPAAASPTADASAAFPTGSFQRNITDIGPGNGMWTFTFDSSGALTETAPDGFQPGLPGGATFPLHGTYVVQGNQITIHDVPACSDGVFTWVNSSGSLTFQVVGSDSCSNGGRKATYTDGPWAPA